MATYHPAALLRNEGYKRPTWDDFKLIRDEYKNLTVQDILRCFDGINRAQ